MIKNKNIMVIWDIHFIFQNIKRKSFNICTNFFLIEISDTDIIEIKT